MAKAIEKEFYLIGIKKDRKTGNVERSVSVHKTIKEAEGWMKKAYDEEVKKANYEGHCRQSSRTWELKTEENAFLWRIVTVDPFDWED